MRAGLDMTPFVADSSVAIAWVIPSQSTASTDDLLYQVGEGRPIVVPALWPLEVGNVLSVLCRRGRIDAAKAGGARQALAALRIRMWTTPERRSH